MSEHNKSATASLGGSAPQKSGTWWCPDRDETSPPTVADTENTKPTKQPFAMSGFIGAQLAAVRGYWNSLKRGNANMPFTDDFLPAALGKMAANVALVYVFQKPQGFRIDLVGAHVGKVYGADLGNRFADELRARAPLDYFVAQCATTVESTAPTVYDHPRIDGSTEYQRLMLPLWGDGRVNAILTAFDFRKDSDVV